MITWLTIRTRLMLLTCAGLFVLIVTNAYLTKKLADTLKVKTHLVSRIGPGDGILISTDRNPNMRGALVTGLVSSLPDANDVKKLPAWNDSDGVLLHGTGFMLAGGNSQRDFPA